MVKWEKNKTHGNNSHYYGDAFIWNFNLTLRLVDNTSPCLKAPWNTHQNQNNKGITNQIEKKFLSSIKEKLFKWQHVCNLNSVAFKLSKQISIHLIAIVVLGFIIFSENPSSSFLFQFRLSSPAIIFCLAQFVLLFVLLFVWILQTRPHNQSNAWLLGR